MLDLRVRNEGDEHFFKQYRIPLIVITLIVVAIAGLFYFVDQDEISSQEPVANEREHVEAVVSAHELATEAGFEVLEQGGTAADAAVAVASTLSVVEPWFSSALGGGTWALYYDAESGDIVSLDGVGPVGSLATVEDYSQKGDDRGMHQAIVPGAWDGWMLLMEEYGELNLDDVLDPSIRIAQDGYPVSEDMATWLGRLEDDIEGRPEVLSIYAPDGELLEEGDTVYQSDMARMFQDLSNAYNAEMTSGRDAAFDSARDHFYRGPIAESIVEFSEHNGGYLTLDDLNDFEAELVDPIHVEYDEEISVFQNPPNSQGITMLLALNILKGMDIFDLDHQDPDVIHATAEALKLAFSDRHNHVGDPERVDVPVDALLSNEHADSQRARIDMEQAMNWPIDDGLNEESHTTTFHIVDRYGNAVAVTTSLGAEFLVVNDTGIHINNRMRMIALEDGDPNQLTPGYKVRHTSNPYMALKNGMPYILGGNTGVDTQPQGQTQQFINVHEFGLSAQDAVAAPRFVTTSFPAGTFPHDVQNVLQMEDDFSDDLMDDLRERGHEVQTGVGVMGSANMLIISDDRKSADVGAEPRQETSSGRSIPAN